MTNTIGNAALELNKEELEMIVGGKPEFSGETDQYKGVVGAYYYIVSRENPNCWYYGKLVHTHEKKIILWYTRREHVVDVERSFDGSKGRKFFYGSDFALYRYAKGI